ncbi:MAG: hypothetical protein VB092_02350 [Oscillospiraceae bacterium]|nr:hypothetical protein [Oscillospiraceae bacterium]
MFRFFKKFALFCVPFVLALAFFAAFEPYDYWLLRGECLYMCRSLNSVRRLQTGECENIILGNSLMANLNESYIEDVSDIDYDNLAYGGATMDEIVDQFWYAAQHNDLQRVVIGLNFYIMNSNYRSGRWAGIQSDGEHPLDFIGDFGYWTEAFDNARTKAQNLAADALGREELYLHVDDPSSLQQDTQPDMTRDADGDRENIKTYAGIIFDQTEGYDAGGRYVDDLVEIAAYCSDNGIELTFVMMNCHKLIWEKVVYPRQLDGYINYYKRALKSCANVIDFEFDNDYSRNDAIFLDGFHMVLSEKKRLMEVIFAGAPDAYAVITTPEQYLTEAGGGSN